MSFFRWLNTLEDTLSDAGEWDDAELNFKIRSYVNALYEGLVDRATHISLAAGQAIRGHNHGSSHSDSNGGRRIARHLVYEMSKGGDFLTEMDLTPVSTFIDFDANWTHPRRSAALALMKAWCSEGWDTPGVGVPTVGPYLEAEVYYSWTPALGTDVVEIKFENTSLSRDSAVTSISAVSAGVQQNGYVTITKIPCQEEWNNLNIKAQATVNPVLDFQIYKVQVYELSVNMGASNGTKGV